MLFLLIMDFKIKNEVFLIREIGINHKAERNKLSDQKYW